ncbi:MAG TPA: FAD-dependent oxidoreductase [Candidatus Paceibacterota bacterium]|uniref:Alkyl hydroperoxide reductase n=1 Tax=Candidatus Giovannonibacteria bacterium GW2011_GWA2_53_7 TaxID=1618650 RepID=A0A0G1XZZ7_9BACT|nr:MAG: Alkyl hydroperoxide reductase [Candidatus Giovannonibacteria bacterium GW2011_GWA2_53_7]
MNPISDLAIIGGGPAGVAAGVYASRKRLRTVFITKDWGGQSLVSPEIQNWIGTIKVSGLDLGEMLKNHLKAYAEDIVDIQDGELVAKIEKSSSGFFVRTESSKTFETKTVLITAGSHRRKLDVPNADRFEHNGITYCASCDGPLFAGLDVAVVGGGNAGFETAAQLLAYCKSVMLLHRGDEFKADPVTVKKVLANPKMHALLNAEILSVEGDRAVTGLVYRTKEKPDKQTLPVQGIFVEIGSVPSTEFVKELVELDKYGQIVVDPRNQRASIAGVWAAGDVTDGLYHQNNIAAGDAVKALEDIYLYLHASK